MGDTRSLDESSHPKSSPPVGLFVGLSCPVLLKLGGTCV